MTGSKEEAAVRQVIEAWADAVRRRDYAAIMAHHSADMLMFDVPPPFQSKGMDAYRKSWDLFFKWAPTPAVFDIREINITAGDDVAFANAAMRCAGTHTDGKYENLDFRLTIGLRKIAGQWTIVHEHHSVPAED
jgi:uncharacterized protein (TIGR02246 family)